MNASAKSLEKILGTGGLAERLTAELDVERAERHEAARKIVVAAEARYPKDIAPAMAAHSAAQAKLKAIIDSQEPALADCIKAAARVDEIRDAHRAVTDPAQAVMLANADPAIDVFIAELITLKTACANLHRHWPDERGKYSYGGIRSSDNREAVTTRVRVIVDLIDEAQRMKINPNVADCHAEIVRLRATVPAA